VLVALPEDPGEEALFERPEEFELTEDGAIDQQKYIVNR